MACHCFLWNTGLGVGVIPFYLINIFWSIGVTCMSLCLAEMSSALPFTGMYTLRLPYRDNALTQLLDRWRIRICSRIDRTLFRISGRYFRIFGEYHFDRCIFHSLRAECHRILWLA